MEQAIFQPTTIAIKKFEEEGDSKHDVMSVASFIQSLCDNIDHDVNAMEDEDDLESGGDGSRRSTSTEDLGSSSIGKEETKWIERAKSMIICIVGLAMSVASFAVHDYTNREVEKVFRERFRNAASQIIEITRSNVEDLFKIHSLVGAQITALALATDMAWPRVLVSEFEAVADQALDRSKANNLWFLPLVADAEREAYEEFWVASTDRWVPNSLLYSKSNDTNIGIFPSIFDRSDIDNRVSSPAAQADRYAPIAQAAPFLKHADIINLNALSVSNFNEVLLEVESSKHTLLSNITNYNPSDYRSGKIIDDADWPKSYVVSPVFSDMGTVMDDGSTNRTVVAMLAGEVAWHNLFHNVLPEGNNGVLVVLRDGCARRSFSYALDGPSHRYLGSGDGHDSGYDSFGIVSELDFFIRSEGDEGCIMTMSLYPTKDFAGGSNTAVVYTIVVVVIFLVAGILFLVYDQLVKRRQEKVMNSIYRSNAIVHSIFPAQVRDRLMDNAQRQTREGKVRKKGLGPKGGPSFELNEDIQPHHQGEPLVGISDAGRPIADLFPECSVIFADLVGFTAWSSTRTPCDVFALLEALYAAFDALAKRNGVFKVETIGDCYVAVTGLPEPNVLHAVAMVRFGRLILNKMVEIVHQLQVKLGPGTSDLAIRIGIHSGPVTAGVLRGERSRFQLFGDTVNTAARMESSGRRNRVHLSKATADLLTMQGKSHWIEPVKENIVVKGKGVMQTFMVVTKAGSGNTQQFRNEDNETSNSTCNERGLHYSRLSDAASSLNEDDHKVTNANDCNAFDIKDIVLPIRSNPTIDWVTDLLKESLKKIVAMCDAVPSQMTRIEEQKVLARQVGSTALDEVKECIQIPTKVSGYKKNPESIYLPDEVVDQLHGWVRTIAGLYHANEFHCFQHASHVTQSTAKLLERIVSTKKIDYETLEYMEQSDQHLHDSTFGIASDPLTQFACIFSALIHDADHQGVPNATLVIEQSDIALVYNNKSVAEQNSVDLAWDLLMEPSYDKLRACIYKNPEELKRFRQLVVNSVLATDIIDKELGALRKARWEKAFATPNPSMSGSHEDLNRKATIVIEHLIQASDVSHTMQHWHVYTKWNEKLFREMHKAYKSGRAATDPTEGWYEGELGFFDYYVIPLAKKLKECGVFGVSSDEYLNYALQNRAEWEEKGREIVQCYVEAL